MIYHRSCLFRSSFRLKSAFAVDKRRIFEILLAALPGQSEITVIIEIIEKAASRKLHFNGLCEAVFRNLYLSSDKNWEQQLLWWCTS